MRKSETIYKGQKIFQFECGTGRKRTVVLAAKKMIQEEGLKSPFISGETGKKQREVFLLGF